MMGVLVRALFGVLIMVVAGILLLGLGAVLAALRGDASFGVDDRDSGAPWSRLELAAFGVVLILAAAVVSAHAVLALGWVG